MTCAHHHPRLLALCAVFLLLFPIPQLQAASPQLGGLTPRGGQRGTELEVVLNGARLDDAQEVMFYEPGIEVTSLEAVNAGSVKVKFKIAPDCVLGSHRFRVRTASGLSDLRTFFVGALPEIQEKEPNSDFTAPQAIPLNVTVNGNVASEDVDYFVVDAKKGDRITAEVEGIRLGVSMFDVYVAILNSARFELDASDDNALLWQDCVASIIAPEDGQYIIQVRDSAYTGSGLYRVHIGTYPRPLAVLPAGGKLGDALDVRFIGDVGGDTTQTITLPSLPVENFGLFASDARGIAPSQNWFRLSPFGNVLEQEPNETHDTATVFTPPLALNGVLAAPGDTDNFRFTAKKGEVYDIRVHARSIRSPLDSVLTVLRLNGGAVASNDDAGGPDSALRFTAPNDGEFVVNVRDHLKGGGPNYTYRIELSPVQPGIKLVLTEIARYQLPTVSVPRGNRFGVLVSASRTDFGGPLALRAENLPPGVTVEVPPLPANLNVVPVLFSVAADAQLSSSWADLVAALNDPKQPDRKIEGRLVQDYVMIRGNNQAPFWTEVVPRLAVAVTEELPFSLSIVQPKVPVVRNGSLQLKVVAERKEDFKAPIAINMLWSPPGISASSSAVIPEGQNEGIIVLNAAANAELNTWKIAVIGASDAGKGQIKAATPFADLRVAEKYLNLAFDASAVEQGKETEVVIKMEKLTDFEGPAKIELLGLPNKVTTEPQEIVKDTKEIIFKVKTDATSPAGNHGSLFCQIVVMENGEPIVHSIGNGRLRIDVPLPPKKTETPAPTPTPMPVAQAAPMPEAPVKRLTRLEQLRLEQAEREKAKRAAANGETPAPAASGASN